MKAADAEKAVEALKAEWGKLLEVSPILELDGNWPSIGVLDQLTFCLRLKEEVSESLEPTVQGAAAYLCLICGKAWEQFVDEVEVQLTEMGFELIGRGGKHLGEGEVLRYPVEQELRRLLREFPYPFPVFRHVNMPINFESSVINLFALGVATALGPAVEAPWQRFEPEDPKPWTPPIIRSLAADSAESYGRMFPDEPLGQVAEFYLAHLIYPPPLIGEDLPFTTAVEQLVARFLEYGVSPEKVLPFAKNLSLMPDDFMSSAGLALVAALSEEMPPPEVLAAAEAKRNFVGVLRSAMLRVRTGFAGRSDWIITGIEDDAAAERFRIETAMGFVPWSQFDLARLRDADDFERLRPILRSMCGFELADAARMLDELIEEDPGDITLRVQRVKFSMAAKEFDAADTLCANLISEPGAEQFPRLYNLWGLIKLEKREFEKAARYFKNSLAASDSGSPLHADIANNLAWALMIIGKEEQALSVIDEAIDSAHCPLTMLLNKMSILWGLKRASEVAELRKQLFALAPLDRRVFVSLGIDEEALEQLLQ